jgi:hypothetical protein
MEQWFEYYRVHQFKESADIDADILNSGEFEGWTYKAVPLPLTNTATAWAVAAYDTDGSYVAFF